MQEALQHPRFGYYATRDPMGAGGDFVTAPEVSQVFGELIGLWCADTWVRMGQPDPILLVELGPGRGTLMGDALRAVARVAEFRRAINLHLVETGERLRQVQEERLVEHAPTWHRDLATVPNGPMILVANEFLDALPIVQLERGASAWHERVVKLADRERLTLARTATPSVLGTLVPPALADAAPGSVFEARPAALAIAAHLARRLDTAPGIALFIDYGHAESACGDTLQAVRRHGYCGILEDPGDADLTAHVDFASFAQAARASGADIHGPVTQREFLLRLGIEVRAQQLLAGATSAQRDIVAAGVRRLIDPQEMGTLFKVMAIASPGLPAPDGFAGRAP
jgi:NADH dehydrogenase [ubiquinone] 1 alpha subcomplex assembly factor 7